MNASALKYDSRTLNTDTSVLQSGWRMLGQFPTIEAAKQLIERMKLKGIETRTVMIDGVTVISRGA